MQDAPAAQDKPFCSQLEGFPEALRQTHRGQTVLFHGGIHNSFGKRIIDAIFKLHLVTYLHINTSENVDSSFEFACLSNFDLPFEDELHSC
jgi:hypothetical protein